MSAMPGQPALKEMKCPNCGSPISQFNPNAQTVVCPTCSSYVAVGMGDAEVVGKSRKLPKSPVPIELGSTITVEDVEYLVMGRVMYQGWDDEDRWSWNEWMLGAPDGRMLWLSFDEKGFGLFTKQRFRQQFDPRNDRTLAMGEVQVPIRERYPAKILGAEGELTWRAKENERLYMAEGARGGKRYSVQMTDEELEVYEGRGVDQRTIARAFKDEAWLGRIERRERNRQNRKLAGGICILFAFVALAAALMLSALGETVVQDQSVTLDADGANLPINYDIAGRPSHVRMRLRGSLPLNTFVDVDVNMIAPDGTVSYLFSQSFWHETGVDDEGRWEESDYNGAGMFVPLSTGQHQLQIVLADTTADPSSLSANVTVQKGVVVLQWFIAYAVIAGIVGVLFYMSVPSKTVT